MSVKFSIALRNLGGWLSFERDCRIELLQEMARRRDGVSFLAKALDDDRFEHGHVVLWEPA
jgi:hypothetical protein